MVMSRQMVWALTVLQATDCSTYISTVESSSVQILRGCKHVCVFDLKTIFFPFHHSTNMFVRVIHYLCPMREAAL